MAIDTELGRLDIVQGLDGVPSRASDAEGSRGDRQLALRWLPQAPIAQLIERLPPSEVEELLLSLNPALVLDGDTPRLIDEWQLVPEIWNTYVTATGGPGYGTNLACRCQPTRGSRLYTQTIDGEVMHYQGSSDLEVDAIVQTGNSWGAFEIKLGGERRIEEGAATLVRFKERIDTSKSGDPAVLAIIVGTGYGYFRKDGVHVIPVGCPGP